MTCKCNFTCGLSCNMTFIYRRKINNKKMKPFQLSSMLLEKLLLCSFISPPSPLAWTPNKMASGWGEKMYYWINGWMRVYGAGRTDWEGLASSFTSRSSLCCSRTTVTAACQLPPCWHSKTFTFHSNQCLLDGGSRLIVAFVWSWWHSSTPTKSTR